MCGIVWEVISDKISIHSYSREGKCLDQWGAWHWMDCGGVWHLMHCGGVWHLMHCGGAWNWDWRGSINFDKVERRGIWTGWVANGRNDTPYMIYSSQRL